MPMTRGQFDAFAEMLGVVAEYCNRPLSAGVIGVYWNGLKDLDLDDVRHALNAHVQNPDTGQFMPKIADIRRMLGGTTQDAAMVAWAKLDKALRVVGPYVDTVFDDPLIHRVMSDMGGWTVLANKTETEWPFVAKEFETRYRGYRVRGDQPEYPSVLIGIASIHNASIHNARQGRGPEQIVMVGDQDKCLAVMAGGTGRPMLGLEHVSRALPKQSHSGPAAIGA